jgi:hypothetical protein
MPMDPARLALELINRIPAMVAYWDKEQSVDGNSARSAAYLRFPSR